MSQHTWFVKSKELYLKEKELIDKLELYENEDNYLTKEEAQKLLQEANYLFKENETGVHDIFRTNKRNKDGTYLDTILTSEEECFEWIEDPKNLVTFRSTIFDTDEQVAKYKERGLKRLKQFWKDYPNGVIYFG